MKRVLIISQSMEIGGAERALLGLLNSFDYSNYRVDLFLCRQAGELFDYIPPNVNILPENQAKFLAIPMKNLIRKKQFKMLYGRIKAKIFTETILSRRTPSVNKKYSNKL